MAKASALSTMTQSEITGVLYPLYSLSDFQSLIQHLLSASYMPGPVLGAERQC